MAKDICGCAARILVARRYVSSSGPAEHDSYPALAGTAYLASAPPSGLVCSMPDMLYNRLILLLIVSPQISTPALGV